MGLDYYLSFIWDFLKKLDINLTKIGAEPGHRKTLRINFNNRIVSQQIISIMVHEKVFIWNIPLGIENSRLMPMLAGIDNLQHHLAYFDGFPSVSTIVPTIESKSIFWEAKHEGAKNQAKFTHN